MPIVLVCLALLPTLWAGCSDDPVAPPDPGSTLVLRTMPEGLGPPWTLNLGDGGVAVGYGDSTLQGLPAGRHTLIWSRLPGWVSPSPDTVAVDLAVGRNDSILGKYRLPWGEVGMLVIRTEPADILPHWQVDGPLGFTAEGDGPMVLEEVPAGHYSLYWGYLTGYHPPAIGRVELDIAAGSETICTGIYHLDTGYVGTVFIDAEPDTLIAGWTLSGPDGWTTSGAGDASISGLISGYYSLQWQAADPWGLPHEPAPLGWLQAAGRLAFQGIYLSPDPVAVPAVAVSQGQVAGQVVVEWNEINYTVVGMDRYLVACSPDGPITEATWPTASLLAELPSTGLWSVYRAAFDETDGLLAGRDYWFGVRGYDLEGRTVPPGESPLIQVPESWHLDGQVFDHLGKPLVGAAVDIVTTDGSFDHRVWTDDEGRFVSGPLLVYQEVDVATATFASHPGLYYDYGLEDRLPGQDHSVSIVLLPRHGLDPLCPEFSEFLDYFRAMTKTTYSPGTILWRWEDFPVSVFIPDYTNGYQHDMDELCRGMLGLWNETMGEELFVEVADAQQAQIVFRFGTDIPGVSGQVRVVSPPGAYIGTAIPEKMEVYILATIPFAQRVQEVALHELGHTLGIAAHSTCQPAGYLMYVSSNGALDDGPQNAIHPDEKALVQGIIHLGQGTDMADYLR